MTETDFCTKHCGWHSYATYSSGLKIKFAWIGVPPASCPGCYLFTNTPNNNFGVDAAVSVVAHELAEAATDPTFRGWQYGYENADLCAWYFPYKSCQCNGAGYNMQVGGRNYLVQANYNMNTGSCEMSP